jgi:LysM repeat protein
MVNRTQFAYQLLAALGIRPTADNIAAIVAWETLEDTQARNNPLATERSVGLGENNFNSVGVKNYPSLAVGIAATVLTLENGYYGDILTSLNGGSFAEITAAIDSSPWGDTDVSQVTPNYEAEINSADVSIYPSYPPGRPVQEPAPVQEPVTVKEPTPVQEPTPQAPQLQTYIIQPGDTLWGISQRFGVSEQALFAANQSTLDAAARARGLSSSEGGHWIFPGTRIVIP